MGYPGLQIHLIWWFLTPGFPLWLSRCFQTLVCRSGSYLTLAIHPARTAQLQRATAHSTAPRPPGARAQPSTSQCPAITRTLSRQHLYTHISYITHTLPPALHHPSIGIGPRPEQAAFAGAPSSFCRTGLSLSLAPSHRIAASAGAPLRSESR